MDWSAWKQRFRFRWAETLDAISNLAGKGWTALGAVLGAVGSVLADGWHWLAAQGEGLVIIVGASLALAFAYALIGIAFLIRRFRGPPENSRPPGDAPRASGSAAVETGFQPAEIVARLQRVEGDVVELRNATIACKTVLLSIRKTEAERRVANHLSETMKFLPKIPDIEFFDGCKTDEDRENAIEVLQDAIRSGRPWWAFFPSSDGPVLSNDEREIYNRLHESFNKRIQEAGTHFARARNLHLPQHEQQRERFLLLRSQIIAFHEVARAERDRRAGPDQNWEALDK